MRYSRSIRFAGDLAKAFEISMTVLLANDFRLVSKTPDRLEFAGPGVVSKRRNAISGVSRICVSGSKGSLAIEAELGGVKRLGCFLVFFPLGLAIFFCLLFGVLFQDRGFPFIAMLSVAPLLPWVVLSPLMTYVAKVLVVRALENLLSNMEIGGRS